VSWCNGVKGRKEREGRGVDIQRHAGGRATEDSVV
jgi:hypothetical protein